jgi:type II restriction enzyme
MCRQFGLNRRSVNEKFSWTAIADETVGLYRELESLRSARQSRPMCGVTGIIDLNGVNLDCDPELAARYRSQSQKARVLTEDWVARNGFCLACSSDRLVRSVANKPCNDFTCPECNYRYELKAFRSRPARRLLGGAYDVLLSSIMRGDSPVLLLLERSEEWRVINLSALHPVFLTSEVIEKRKPLSGGAKRAGWIGCNIRLDMLAPDAEIPIVHRGVVSDRKGSRDAFRRFQQIADSSPANRGWTNLILRILRERFQGEFCLADVYECKPLFASVFPRNRHIEAKIRQQLQVLRDLEVISFLGSGRYLLNTSQSA